MTDSIDKINMKDQFKECIEKCRQAMNTNFDYEKAYDFAVQAKYIAEVIIQEPLNIFESELLRGLSKLGIDRMSGHEILNKLYYESQPIIRENADFIIRVTTAMGTAKKLIGEHDEALTFYHDSLKLCQKQIEQEHEDSKNYLKNIIRIIRVISHIVVSLLYKSRQNNYPTLINIIENQVREIGYDNLESVKKVLDEIAFTSELSNELEESERYINEALRMTKEYKLKEMELTCLLNKATVLNEKGEYLEAIKILDFLEIEEFIIKNALGYILNEKGIAYINIGKLEMGIEILHKAWNWLCKKKDMGELCRNLYGTGLYHYKNGELSMAYTFAEMAYSHENDLCSLMLLHEITLLKYIQARRHGNESEYAFYRSEYEKYKSKLERRG